ncbi:MAG TPA: CC/Se motif family (seleno)protein [Verrucomicrobiae bacterium]|nr:CC/Se motif family (seleno)protein [Verrucomicrobiae bacterium]
MLTIEDSAVKYVAERGGVITLEPVQSKVCCGAVNLPPEIRVGKPLREEQKYVVQTIAGVSVYVHEIINTNRPMTIELQKFLGISRLSLSGWVVL